MKSNFHTLAALLMAGTVLSACSSSDEEILEQKTVTPTETSTKYIMNIGVSKGSDAATRALAVDGDNLKSTWNAGEQVGVYFLSNWRGTLSSASSETNTTHLTGTVDISEDILHNDLYRNENFHFWHPNNQLDYTGQIGTIEDISANHDFAFASVSIPNMTITEKTGTGNTRTIEAAQVPLYSGQAIVKFILKAGGGDLDVKSLTIADGYNRLVRTVQENGSITVIPTTPTNTLYVALRGIEEANLGLYATTEGGGVYYFSQPNVTFENGGYYDVTVNMINMMPDQTQTQTIDLSTYGKNVEATTANKIYVITGTAPAGGRNITVGDKALVVLQDANTSGGSITCTGNCTLSFEGTNVVGGGITIENGTLTIGSNSGTLTVTTTTSGNAGICGLNGSSNISITGGEISATGNNGGAGIGSASGGTCGFISILGGTITAVGNGGGAGIGTGYNGSSNNITVDNTINRVVATRGSASAAYIGKGAGSGSTGTISIPEASQTSDAGIETVITDNTDGDTRTITVTRSVDTTEG